MNFIQIILLEVILLLALITDTKSYKINNGYLVIGSISGFVLNIILEGKQGLMLSLLGFVFPIIILMILFALSMLGAGDIKLFAAIGAIMGFRFICYAMLYSFLVGGMMALVILLRRRILFERLRYFVDYIINCLYNRKFEPYYDLQSEGYKYTMHFSYAIGVGVVIELFNQTIL